jgi:DNA replication protein DnaC
MKASLSLDNLPMIAFACELHGEYESRVMREGMDLWCPVCSHKMVAMVDAAKQHYREQGRRHELYLAAEVPHKFRSRTLANWNPADDRQRKTLEVAQRWSSDVPARVASGRGLMLYGPPGLGKTHLLAGLVAEVCKAGYGAAYCVWADALARTKATFNSVREHPDRDLLERLATVPVLALDELGGPASDFDACRLFELIDARYRDGRPTLVGTNLAPSNFNTLGERAADRLREMCVKVPLAGESRRGYDNGIAVDAPLAVPQATAPLVALSVTINGETRQFERVVDFD